MATTLQLLGLLTLSLILTLTLIGAQPIGVCYGRLGNNLPSPVQVVSLYKSRNIGRMRIYDPYPPVLQALRGSNIELILGVPNTDLQTLASDPSAATKWVETNVKIYSPAVKFRYIAVGNEISPVNGDSRFAQFLLPAMQNVYNAIAAANLQNQIKVSTAIDTSVIGKSFPPSEGVFRGEVTSFVDPIIRFLVNNRAPLLVNIYPYFSFISTPNLKLSYALFTNQSPEFTDSGNGLVYHNLFDAILDGVYAAVEKRGGSSLEIVVSESGWPSAGGMGSATSIDNARNYNQNLISHVKKGSPKKPGTAIETYLFAMFEENLKNPEFEKHFGLFLPNQQPVYPINFS